MVPKKIFSRNQLFLKEVVVKKILNKNLYEKSYIRGSLMDSNTIQIIDNNATFYNLIPQGVSKIYNKGLFEGSSLSADTFFYKNRLNSNLKFRSFMLNSIKSENLLDSFYKSLKTLEVGLKNCYPSLLVLKPLKGGFACYSSGIYGFLPRSHGVYFVAKTLVSILKDKEVSNRLSNLNYLLQNSKTLKTSFLMRLEFLLGKVIFYLPASKQDSFFSLSKKRKEAFVNDYNFIFLSQRVQKFKLNKKIPLVLNAKTKKINPKKIKKIVKK